MERSDVDSYRRRRRLSPEQAAREVRYTFLTTVATEQHADAVALGHTADDQAETVLMHILRGSGLTGLRGMQTSSYQGAFGREVLLVRPLLGASRDETAAYCRALGLETRIDASNLSLEPRRNRVRMELMPLLQGYNPGVRQALIRLSQSAAKDLAYLERGVESAWPGIVREGAGALTLSREGFRRLDPAIQNHLLRRALTTLKGGSQDIEQTHIDAMARLMLGPAGRSLDMPGGLRFSVSYSEAKLVPSGFDQCPLPPLEGEHELKVPGEGLVAGWRIQANLAKTGQGQGIANFPGVAKQEGSEGYSAVLDYHDLGGPLRVRSRMPGDRFQPLGMPEAKKLQDFMVDSKIPRPWRDRVPLVVSPKGIAWVVGWRIAHWARVKSLEAPRLRLRFALEEREDDGHAGTKATSRGRAVG